MWQKLKDNFSYYTALWVTGMVIPVLFIAGMNYNPTPPPVHYKPMGSITYLKAPEINKEALLTNYVFQNSLVPREVAQRIVQAALKTNRPELLLAIFKKESTYDPHRIGPKTKYGYAYGLGQVMWSIWQKELRAIGINDARSLFEIETGTKASAHIIKIYITKAGGDIFTALSKYYGARDAKYNGPIIKTYVHLIELTNTKINRSIHGYDWR